MKHFIDFQRVVIVVICLATSFTTGLAQGVITGTVIDPDLGETLIAAHVSVEEAELVGTTDFDGKYTFDVPAGTYSVKASYIGFEDKRITEIEVKDGEVVYLDIVMATASTQLDEVVVKAQVIERSENALLMLRQKAVEVQEVYSAQEMSRLAVGDAAAAMTKMPGTSVQDGKYVVVRGLGDRYSLTMLNGLQLPSIDPYRNSAQLDLIPSNLLENIVTSKTFTPDMPGSFTGGSVNIKTKSFPETRMLTVSLSTGFNSQNHYENSFLTHDAGNRDWIGYAKNDLARPEILSSAAFEEYGDKNAELKARFGDENAANTIDEVVDAVDMRFDTVMKRSFMDYGIGISYGNSFTIGQNSRLGVIGSINHQMNVIHRPDMIRASYLALQDVDGNPFLRTNGDYRVTRSAENPVVNGFAGVAYKFNDFNSIEFKTMYNHNATKSTSYVIGEDGDNIEDPLFKLGRALQYEERQMINYQIEGRSVIPAWNNFQIEYKANLVDATRDEPNLHYLSSQWNSETNSHGIPLANVNDPFIFWRDLTDEIINARVDFTLPFKLFNADNNKFKFGGLLSRKDRDFNEYQYRVARSQFADPYDGDPDTYFGPDNTGVINQEERPNGTTRYFIGNYITQATSPRNSYFGQEDVNAFYGMFTLQATPALKVIAGARYEQTDIFVQSKIVTNEIEEADSTNTGSIKANDLLPSLNLVYALTDKMNLRAGYNQTLARPNLREIAPFASFDPIIDEFFNGNPTLQKTDIQNLDLRWEYFMNPGEVIAVSAFYKKFDNPIVVQYLVSTNPEFIYVNADEGEIRGIEFELRKNLGFISESLSPFKLTTNFSIISSSTDVVSNFDVVESERSFVGQSDFLANVVLSYTDLDRAMDIALAYNYTGDRLAEIGQLTETAPPTDIFEKSINSLDFVISKRFGDLGLRLAARNLLNPDIIEFIPFVGSETITSQFRRGRSFNLSLSYRL